MLSTTASARMYAVPAWVICRKQRYVLESSIGCEQYYNVFQDVVFLQVYIIYLCIKRYMREKHTLRKKHE
jgi:hypothetical protein